MDTQVSETAIVGNDYPSSPKLSNVQPLCWNLKKQSSRKPISYSIAIIILSKHCRIVFLVFHFDWLTSVFSETILRESCIWSQSRTGNKFVRAFIRLNIQEVKLLWLTTWKYRYQYMRLASKKIVMRGEGNRGMMNANSQFYDNPRGFQLAS